MDRYKGDALPWTEFSSDATHWTDLDKALLEAYQIYQDEHSLPHGVPVYLALNKNNEIDFELDESDLDRAQAELDKMQHEIQKRQQKQGEKYRPQYGLRPTVRAKSLVSPDIDELALRRQFYEDRTEEINERKQERREMFGE